MSLIHTCQLCDAGGPAFRVLCEGWGFWPTR
jgi:hypothetical protein